MSNAMSNPKRVAMVSLLVVGVLVTAAAEQDLRERREPTQSRRSPYPVTPEEREQFYNRVVERQLSMATRLYDLTPEQQVQVRARLEQLKEEHRQYAEPRQQELEQLREQMRDVLAEGRASGKLDNARVDELGSRIREIISGSPFLNMNTAAAEIEKLLPPEQAERGRILRQQRREAAAEIREEMRQRGIGLRERLREQAELRAGDPGLDDPEAALGSWELYVRRFVRWYRLDPAQRATAQSVLRGALEQRQVYESSRRADYEIVNQIEDETRRQERLKELNAPVQRMFEDLKRQLDRIPTAAQREAAEGRGSTTQPASASTRPAGGASATRPSGP